MISGQFNALSRQSSELERLRSRLLSRTALCGVISLGMLFGGSPRQAKADPTGTTVVSGGITIQQSGTHTQFNQTTNTAILNHSSFDIRANESVHFQQPSANALAVNRVVGSDVSTTIAGKLTATGNVWVLNPSGVAISSGAQINVNGLVASTASISDDAIAAGRASGSFAFSGAADGTSVTNAGNITAGDGHVVLVAPVVENSGTITTDGSEIAIGAGSGFTVDMDHDGLTRFEVQPGNGVSLTHTGTLSAQGGAVYLSADAAGSVEGAVVSVGGQVEATRIENRGGQIVISAGENGTTEVTGTISAVQTQGAGGQIVVTGEEVEIAETAVIDASGVTDGGKVEIGGGLQGRAVESPVVRTASASAPTGAPLPVAKRTSVAEGAVIRANAGDTGNGGEVIVWSDVGTEFFGTIEARGGAISGDGGFAEVSGKETLFFSGSVDLAAVNGAGGNLLLDPDNITISSAADAANNLNVGTLVGLLDAGASVTVNTSSGLNGLNGPGGDGTGADAGTITVSDDITTNIVNAGAGASLTLVADSTIDVNGNISDTGEALSVNLQAGGTVTINSANSINIDGDVDVTSVGDTTLSSITAATLDVTTSSDGSILQQSGSTIVVSGNTSLTADGLGNITLAELTNDFNTVDASGLSLQFSDANNIEFDVVTATTNFLVTATAGSVTDSGGSISVGGLTSLIADVVNIDQGQAGVGQNTFGSSVSISAGQIVTFQAAAGLNVGNITITDGTGLANDLFTQTGLMSVAGTISVAGTSTLQLTALNAGSVINQTAGTITADTLIINGNPTTATFNEAGNDINTLSSNNLNGNGASVTFTDADDIAISGIDMVALTITATDVDVTGASTVAGTLSLTNSAGDATDLLATSAGGAADFEIDNTDLGNLTVATLAIDSGNGAITVDGVDAASSGTIGSVSLSAGTEEIDFSGSASTFSGLTTSSEDIVVSVGVSVTNTLSATNSEGDAVQLGGNATGGAGNFEIAQAELDNLTVGTLAVATSAGDIEVTEVVSTNIGAVSLAAGTGNIDFNTGPGGSGTASTFAALTVSSATNITDSDNNALSITGNADFNASGDIILDQLVEIGGEIDATATNIDLRSSSGSFDLDVITAGGTLTLVNPGSITDTATSVISVTGTTLLDPDVVINIDRTGTHQFGGNVQLSTGQITQFASTGNINFGNSSATTAGVTNTITTAGNVEFDGTFSTEATADLTLELGAGSITQDAGLTTTITTDVLTINSAGGTVNVTLDDATNDFNTVQTGATALTSLTVQDADSIDLGGINTGALTVTANGAGDITDTGVLTVTGTSSFTASANTVQLDSANLFTGAVSATGDTVILVDADVLTLGTIAAANSLSATSSGGDLVIDNAVSVDSGDIALNASANVDINANLTTTTSGNITINSDTDNTSGGDIDIAGGTSIVAAGVLDVDTGTSTGQMIDTGAGTVTLSSGGAFDFENTTFDEANLVLTAGGGVTDAGATSGVLISGTTSVTTTVAASAVELDNAANDFGGTVTIDTTNSSSITGGVVTIQDANSVTLGAIASTSLSATALGGDVVIGTGIDVTGGDIALTATNTVDIDANLTTTTSGNITLTSDSDTAGGGDIDLVGGISVAAVGTLDVETNDGAMIDNGSGTVTLSSGGVFDFETTNFDNTALALTAGGTVSQTGSVTVTGNASISASGQAVTLSDANNDFGTGLDLIALSIDVQDANALVLGNVSVTGDATIEAVGITDLAAGTDASDGVGVLITGTTSLTSTGAMVLDDVDNDFGTVLVSASGPNVTLVDADDIDLGASTMNQLALTAGGLVSDSGTISVTGTTSIVTTVAGTAVTLDDSGNDFGAAVSVDTTNAGAVAGGAITLVDTNELPLSAITGTSLSATSGGGDLVIDNAITIDGGDIALNASANVDINADVTTTTSGNITISSDTDNTAGGNIDIAGGTSITAFGVLDVDTGGSTGQMIDTGAGTITLTSGGAFDFENTAFDEANLVVVAGGGVTDAGATNGIAISGTTSITTTVAASIVELDSAANDFGSAVSVDTTNGAAVAGGAVTLIDVNELLLGTISGTSLLATSAGGNLVINNAISIDGGNIALNASETVDINANVTTTTSGDITITSDSDVAGGGDIDLLAGTSVTAVGTLDLEANAGAVTDSGGADAVTLTSGDVFDFETTTFDNAALVVSAAGTVSQSGVVTVAGNTSINATGNAIELSDSSNDFGTVLDLRGASADVQDINAIVLGDVSITGDATIEAVGITDLAAGADASDGVGVLIAGTATLASTGAVTLDDVDNDFATVIANAVGQTVTLVDVDGIAIGASSAATLDVTSTDIDLTGTVAVSGATTLTNSADDLVTLGGANGGDEATYELAQSSLDNLATTSLTVISGGGNITSAAADTTTTTNIDGVTLTAGAGTVNFDTGTSSFEALTVASSGTITDTGSVSVTGATDLTSAGAIDLQTVTNDFNSLAISASGQTVTVQDANAITLAAVEVGTLGVTALSGDIIDTASVITVTGTTSLTAAGNNIVLDTSHEFGSTVNATGTDVTLNDANNIELGNVTATNLSIDTSGGNGNVLQTGSTTVSASGNTTINAGSGDITLNENTNDFADAGSAGDIVLTGGAVSIVDADSLRLNGAITAGSFAATARGGAIDQLVALSVTGGDITLNATEQVFVRQNITTTTSGNITVNADTDSSGGGEGVDIVDGSTISSAGTLVVNSGASTLVDSGTGGATLSAVNDLTLDAATVDAGEFVITSTAADVNLTGIVSVTGQNLTVSAANDVDIDANVTTTTSGNITLTSDSDATGGGNIDILGGTSVVAAGILDVEANTGQMIDNGTGTVTLSSAGVFDFETTTFDSAALAVTAAGSVTQSGSVTVSGNTTVSATGQSVGLSDANNDFGTSLDILAASADIQDVNAIVLGNVSVTGDASIEAGAGITDLGLGTDASDSVGVLIAGTSTLTAVGALALDDVDNDFGTVLLNASGQDVTLVDVDGIDLGASTMNQLALTAGGLVSDSGDISVTGATSITTTVAASNVTLDQSGNDFGGPVNVDTTNSGAVAAGVVTLQDANTITLGTINSSSLSASALGGDVIVDTAVDVTGGDIALTASENVDVNANVTTTTSGNITLTSDSDANNSGDIDVLGGTSVVAAGVLDIETNGGQLTDSGSGTVTLQSGGAFDFENTTLDNTTLVLNAGGAVTDAGGAVTVTGTTSITTTVAASAVELDNTLNDFGGPVNVDTTNSGAVAAGVVTLQDANTITLGTINSSSLSASALGGDVIVGTAVDVTGGDIALTASENVDVNANVTTTTSGNITLTSDSDANNSGDIDVLGGTSVVAAGVLDIETNGGQLTDSGSGTVTLQSGGAFDFENTTLDNTTLVLNAGGAVTDAGGAVTVTGTTSITTTVAASAVELDNTLNDFGGPVNVDTTNSGAVAAGVVTLQDANTITLGTINSSSLSASALGGDVIVGTAVDVTGGDIALTASENVDVNANVTTTTSGNITLTSDSDANNSGDIDVLGGTSVVAAGVLDIETNGGQLTDSGSGTVTLQSGGAFDFENTTLDNTTLVLNAGGAVTDAGGAVTVTGTTSITTTVAASAVELDNTLNDFGGPVNVDTTNSGAVAAGVVTLQDANTITLGTINSSSLSASALGGDVIVDTAVDVTGGDIALTASENVDVNANVTTTTSGNITLTSDSDANNSGDIDVLGGTSVVAAGVLDIETNGGQLTDSGSGTVTLQSGGAFDFENTTLDNTTLVLNAGGAVTDAGGAVTVTGTTSITTTVAASAVELDNTLNDFGGPVNVDTTNSGAVAAGVVTLQDANTITLGTINSSSLSASALGGDVIVDTAVDVTGGDIALTASENVDVNANVTTTTSGNITLTSDSDANNSGDIDVLGGTSVVAAGVLDIETNGGQLTDSGSGTVTLQSGGAFDFENTTLDNTTLVLNAGGAVTDAGATNGIFLSNDVTITAAAAGEFFDIALDTVDLHDFGGVVNLTGEDITIDDVNAIELGSISTNEAAQLDADPDAAIDATINTNRGDLIVRAGGAITDAGGSTSNGIGLLIEGVTSLDANSGNSDITLNDVDNDFDQDVDGVSSGDALDDVDAIGSNIVLVDASAIALGTITSGGTLDVTANGSITDTASEAVSVTGITTLTAGAAGEFFDIDIDNENIHDFGGAVNATGEDITLDDVNAIILGAISTNAAAQPGDTTIDTTLATNGGDLIVNAGGTVTDTSDAISVAGITSIVAEVTGNFFDIELDTSNTHDFIGVVNLTGEDITIDDNSSIILGSISTNESGQADADPDSAADTVIGSGLGDLIVRANGAITDDGGSVSDGVGLLIEGTTSLDANSGAADITLDDVDNDFDQDVDGLIADDARDDVDALGLNILLVDTNAIALGTVTAGGTLSVTAAGSITDTAGENISVAGIASLVAESSGDFFDIELDNVGHDFDAVVNVTAEDLTLSDAGGIVLGAISTNGDGSADATIGSNRGDLIIATGGAITDDDAASGLSIAGSTNLTANGGAADIVLDNRLNDFDNNGDFAAGTVSDDVNASGANVVLVDANTLPVGSINGASVSLAAVSGDVTNANNTADNLTAGAGGATVSAEQGDVFLSFDIVAGNLDVEGGAVAIIGETAASTLTVSRGVARDAFVLQSPGDLVITDRFFSGGDLSFISEQGNVNFAGVNLAAVPLQVATGTGTVNVETFSLAGLGARVNDALAYAEGELSISAPNGTVVLPTNAGGNVPVRFISNSAVDVFLNGAGVTDFSTQQLLDLGFSSTQISELLALSNVLEIEVGQNLVLQTAGALPGALLTLDVPASSTARLLLTGSNTDFAIGEQNFATQAVVPGFDPNNFIGSLSGDQLLFDVTGNFDLVIDGSASSFVIQNTSSVIGSTNFGAGMQIEGLFGITVQNGGTLETFGSFGSVNGQSGANTAFQFNIAGFTPNQDQTVNGCILGTVSSCTPLGTLVLNLQFETGQFLGITFVDPDEDEDDPFSNRGDEEEWE